MALSIQALLFDLGGIFVDISFERTLQAWSPFSPLSPNELRSAFRFDIAYERHERGEITREQYFDHLRLALQLRASDASIEAGWNAMLVGEITAARLLLERINQRIPCYLFSNSNATHKASWAARFPRVVGAFRQVFVSSDIGARKPERVAFDIVAGRIGVPPQSILFFDDLIENVEGAINADMHAAHVPSPQDLESIVERLCPQLFS